MVERLARWLDRRIGGAEFVQDKLTKIFPESWTFLFGELALYSFVFLVLSGTYLALFFDPSLAEVRYFGDYAPLQGQKMSVAYRSILRISFDTRAGLMIRQAHHWAALIFIAAIVVHMSRVFFTGAFRKPRELNWMIGVTLLMIGIFEGFAGYSLPDDLLSGIGLRIGYSILESIPVVGLWIASWLFGGMFPGDEIISRLFTIHVFIFPAILGVLIAAHLALIFRQTHTQFPGAGRTERNVVGVRMWPTYTAMSVGLMMLSFAVFVGLGGLVQINPVWLYGPFDPFLVTLGAQPDWYMGWLEGALRIFPPWEFRGFGYMVANPFFPAVLLPAVTFAALYAYPYLERTFTGDYAEHHLLDRPRDRPLRTAFGAAALSFYAMLTIAGSDDLIALQLNVSISGLVWWLRYLTVLVPILVGLLVHRTCRDLSRSSHRPVGAHAHAELEEEDGEEGRAPWWRTRRVRLAFVGLAGVLGLRAAKRDRRDLPL